MNAASPSSLSCVPSTLAYILRSIDMPLSASALARRGKTKAKDTPRKTAKTRRKKHVGQGTFVALLGFCITQARSAKTRHPTLTELGRGRRGKRAHERELDRLVGGQQARPLRTRVRIDFDGVNTTKSRPPRSSVLSSQSRGANLLDRTKKIELCLQLHTGDRQLLRYCCRALCTASWSLYHDHAPLPM